MRLCLAPTRCTCTACYPARLAMLVWYFALSAATDPLLFTCPACGCMRRLPRSDLPRPAAPALNPLPSPRQNLDELADRYASEAFAEGPTSPSSILAARADPRQLAAETLLHMYLKERGGDLLVLLSELQVGPPGTVACRVLHVYLAEQSRRRSCGRDGATHAHGRQGLIPPAPAPPVALPCRASLRLCCLTARSGRCLPRATPRAASRCTTAWTRTARSACPTARPSCPPTTAPCRQGRAAARALPAAPAAGSGARRAQTGRLCPWQRAAASPALDGQPAWEPASPAPAPAAPSQRPPPLLCPALLQWQELPPGHFISGRSPKLQQFALTPAQLSIREVRGEGRAAGRLQALCSGTGTRVHCLLWARVRAGGTVERAGLAPAAVIRAVHG